MKLEELFPELPTFCLSLTKKTYHLRIPTLEDKARFTEWAGGPDKLSEAFKEINWNLIVRFIYRLLVEKEDFLASQESFVDDDGVKQERLVTGPEKLFRSIAGNSKESSDIFLALAQAVSRGEPQVESQIKEVSQEVEKKRVKKSTGATSLTSSALSTDTPRGSLAV